VVLAMPESWRSAPVYVTGTLDGQEPRTTRTLRFAASTIVTIIYAILKTGSCLPLHTYQLPSS
jgi:hypothetical protein